MGAVEQDKGRPVESDYPHLQGAAAHGVNYQDAAQTTNQRGSGGTTGRTRPLGPALFTWYKSIGRQSHPSTTKRRLKSCQGDQESAPRRAGRNLWRGEQRASANRCL